MYSVYYIYVQKNYIHNTYRYPRTTVSTVADVYCNHVYLYLHIYTYSYTHTSPPPPPLFSTP